MRRQIATRQQAVSVMAVGTLSAAIFMWYFYQVELNTGSNKEEHCDGMFDR
jgi:hypothetical protein